MIGYLYTSKTRKAQVNLLNKGFSPNPWKVLEFIGTTPLNIDVEVWVVKLTAKKMDMVFKEWDRV